jgi:D-alanine-D-alanine ligase
MKSLDVGLAFDLRPDLPSHADAPLDAYEEYDCRETIEALAEALTRLGHGTRLLGGGRAFLDAVIAEPPQLVFNLAEGRGSRSREAHVPAACEMLRVPYTHSDPLTMALTLDKSMAKRVVQSAGIRTAPFRVIEATADADRVDLPFPLFVKPVAEGSSMGVRLSSRVSDRSALVREVDRCLDAYRQPVLIETYLSGEEVTVAVRGQGQSARVFGMMEVAPSDGRIAQFVYGLEAKRNYRRQVRYHVPPRSLTGDQCADAERVALAAYRVLGCRDIARVDLRLDAEGRAHFLEINPLPGLNPVTSDLCIMAGLLGVSYQALVGGIVEEAIRRSPALQ